MSVNVYNKINYNYWIVIIIFAAILIRLHLVYLSFEDIDNYFTSDTFEYLGRALRFLEIGSFGNIERTYGYPTFLLVLFLL